jgi:hypothetical protein
MTSLAEPDLDYTWNCTAIDSTQVRGKCAPARSNALLPEYYSAGVTTVVVVDAGGTGSVTVVVRRTVVVVVVGGGPETVSSLEHALKEAAAPAKRKI